MTDTRECRNIATVLLHDYYHRAVFRGILSERDWQRLESRLDYQIDKTLSILDRFGVKATFFTLGWLAEREPEIVRRIAREGHEIASAGFRSETIRGMNREDFRRLLEFSRTILEEASGQPVWGFRCPYKWLRKKEQWVLEVLQAAGYKYDASFRPPLWSLSPQPAFRIHRALDLPGGEIHEFPVSTARLLGLNIPVSGGNYLRQFPAAFSVSAYKKWLEKVKEPFVLYFHPWELDEEIPKIHTGSFLRQIRQYRNLGKLRWLLPKYFESSQFCSIRDYLGLKEAAPTNESGESPPQSFFGSLSLTSSGLSEIGPGRPLSVVVPCYNEGKTLIYLKNALEELRERAGKKYQLEFIFVDDCSSDDTVEVLERLFKNDPAVKIVRHDRNQGVAGAIQTGIRQAGSDWVASIDADCTYDPLVLLDMLKLADDGTDLVIASPYHRNGEVLNVPGWRLFLSRNLSRAYHLVFKNKLATYTACCRVYRKERVADIQLTHGGFIGLVELLARLDLAGGKIREYPAVLHSRLLGHSKMKIINTILGHLKLLWEIFRWKVGRLPADHEKLNLQGR
ncbi:MAG: hypothetical protein Kow0037_32380 [Calditrichia bacterium]